MSSGQVGAVTILLCSAVGNFEECNLVFKAYLSLAVAAGLLAGCSGGSQGTNPVAPAGNPALVGHASPIADVKGGCTAHGGVRVTPCSVTFTSSNVGPFSVTVRTPKNKKGALTELDSCGGASGIATVTQGSGDDWNVTAGAETGSCTATFTYANKHGKTTGSAELDITNSI
jgi:hypothetical protein